MSEETPVFKFKKKTSKKIGDFDVLDTSEWTLLIQPQIQDVTRFIHLHKLWNVEETPRVEADPENGIEEIPEVKASPAWEHIAGFIKDGKFIVTFQKVYSTKTYHEIYKKYIEILRACISEGYTKDYNSYNGEEPIIPQYYSNERTPLGGKTVLGDLSGILRVNGNKNPPSSNIPVSVGVTSQPATKPKNRGINMFKIFPKIINASKTVEVQPSNHP